MKATAELQVVPIGCGVSVRKEITRVLEPHASGTNIEGALAELLSAVEEIHRTLHEEASVRLVSYLKPETRTDKSPSLTAKRL